MFNINFQGPILLLTQVTLNVSLALDNKEKKAWLTRRCAHETNFVPETTGHLGKEFYGFVDVQSTIGLMRKTYQIAISVFSRRVLGPIDSTLSDDLRMFDGIVELYRTFPSYLK